MPTKTIKSVLFSILLCGLILFCGTLKAQAPSGHNSADAAACDHLASVTLSNTTVTSAHVVPAGQFKPPAGPNSGYGDLPAFCRVSMTIKPSSDSDIKSETWLPLSGWNGKFQEVGNGGWNGDIQYGALADGLRRGYATASTDTGHEGGSASFALGHPEKVIDFGYRAIHETALQSKAVIAALYGSPQQLSYFTGCSGGGRQAFAEAQRYPDDFEGIVAGAPGYDRTNESFQLVSIGQSISRDPAAKISPEKLAVLHQAVLDACDALDGVKDGIISDPTRCKFDPEITLCKGADGATCLTRAQVETAKKFYAPLKDPKTGEEVFPGFMPGSELRWSGLIEGPMVMAGDLFKYVVFQDPKWDYMSLDVGKDLALARKIDNETISPTSANLKTFFGRGSKLIIYHGWADQNIAPQSSIEYYDRLVKTLGQKEVNNSVRMYMVPGMGHCGGGEGPNVFDTLTALEKWREKDAAPAEIIASQIAKGSVVRTRPLCPYPQTAHYKGSGNSDQAENFVCRVQ
ncbi:MAG TPA: tannase/feruloyl esterase family alpha/beta hydrolase [Candidatus Acidoferrales bacterium]